MAGTLVIARRFCGPPDSANGGYVAGLLGERIAGAAEVVLRRPPPLERALALDRNDDGTLRLRDGDVVVATAAPTRLDLAIPAPPTYREAELAASRYGGFDHHVFPTCFVCGPARARGDGLRIFAGALDGQPGTAAPWVPEPALADADGRVLRRFVWAALDCPGYFAFRHEGALAMVLGSLAARVEGTPRAGEPCVVTSWAVAREGRKRTAGTAVFSAAGALYGCARAVWVELRDSPAHMPAA